MKKYLVTLSILSQMTCFLSGQTTIAVLDFEARNIPAGEAATLTDRFRDELTKTNRYIVVERSKMEDVLKEQAFQQSGCTTDECIVEVGQLIGVQQMAGGSIGKVGNVYSVSARIIDVQSGAIINVTTYDHKGDVGGLLTLGMRQVVAGLVTGVVAPVVSQTWGVGSLFITSEPGDAIVYIDGIQFTGTTPIMIDTINTGEHEILVQKGDFSTKQTVTIIKDDIQKQHLVLQLAIGKLKVLSNPFNAIVMVDGIKQGLTPVVISKLKVGDHNISVHLDGYETHNQSITIKAKQIEELNINLKKYSFETGTVSDIDGNIYITIKIGNQWWMVENLTVTHYRNGDEIPNVTENTEWKSLLTGAYCNYNNNTDNALTYGKLYNWYAVDDNRQLAPEGWHVPSDTEWQMLINYLGGSSVGKMKETGITHWNNPNTGATNESGFTALPGGYRNFNGDFNVLGDYACFWSSTEYDSSDAWSRELVNYYSIVSRHVYDKLIGYSIRCVRN